MAVEQDIRLHACPAALGKGLGKLARLRTVFVKILGKSDCLLGGFYVPQHDGKRFIAVEQNLDAIPAGDGRAGVSFNRRKKAWLAQSDLRNTLHGNHFGTRD